MNNNLSECYDTEYGELLIPISSSGSDSYSIGNSQLSGVMVVGEGHGKTKFMAKT
jgi:hypothetical protein